MASAQTAARLSSWHIAEALSTKGRYYRSVTTLNADYEQYDGKAAQSWQGAQSELAAGRFDNAVALAYYACFQMACAAMERARISYDRREGYSHGLVMETVGRWMEEANVADQIGSMRTLYDRWLTAQYRSVGLSADVAQNALALADRILAFLRSKLVADERDEDGNDNQAPP